MINESNLSEFTILGFSEFEKFKFTLFFIFFIMYLLTVSSNIFIIGLIFLDNSLKKPMYHFICNMSLIDVFYSNVTTPKLLQLVLSGHKKISFRGCMSQLYFFSSFCSMDYMLLTSMAFDRYVAICRPLIYHVIMTRRTCYILSGLVWSAGFISFVPISVFISRLSYCASKEINHFFCDLTPLLELACDDTSVTEHIIMTEVLVITSNCFSLTLASYVYIISSILKIKSSDGRRKAFSTCASHLILVILFYLLIFCTYLPPSSSRSTSSVKILSVLYVNIIPMLNPLIYSLRNKAVKDAVRKLIR